MNKKFIWILAVILIIIASGVIYFLYKQQFPGVSIITNKSNYSKGEIVKIVIQNNTDLEKNIVSLRCLV